MKKHSFFGVIGVFLLLLLTTFTSVAQNKTNFGKLEGIYVKDSVTYFKAPANVWVFDKQSKKCWLPNSAVKSGTLATISKQLIPQMTIDTTGIGILDGYGLYIAGDSINLGPEVFDSIAAIPILTAGVGLTISNEVISSTGKFANNGATVSGLGIGTNGSTIGSGSIGITTSSGNLLNGSVGLASTSGKLDGCGYYNVAVASSFARASTGLTLSAYDSVYTKSGDSRTAWVTSVNGVRNKVKWTSNLSGDYASRVFIVNSDTTNYTDCSDIISLNASSGIDYSNKSGLTIIGKQLDLPDVVQSIAPSSATSAGRQGEVRITSAGIFICIVGGTEGNATWIKCLADSW